MSCTPPTADIFNASASGCAAGECASTIATCNPFYNYIPDGSFLTYQTGQPANPCSGGTGYFVLHVFGLTAGQLYTIINKSSLNTRINVINTDGTNAETGSGGIGCEHDILDCDEGSNCGSFTPNSPEVIVMYGSTSPGDPIALNDSEIAAVCPVCIKGYYVNATGTVPPGGVVCCEAGIIEDFVGAAKAKFASLPNFSTIPCGHFIEYDYTLSGVADFPSCATTFTGPNVGSPADYCFPLYLDNTALPCCTNPGEILWEGKMMRVCGPVGVFCLEWEGAYSGVIQYGPILDGNYLDIYPPCSETGQSCNVLSCNAAIWGGPTCLCDFCDPDP